VAVCGWALLAAVRAAHATGTGEEPEPATGPDQPGWHLLPGERLYPAYPADPHRVGFAVLAHYCPDPHLPDTGRWRTDLRAGGAFSVLRYVPVNRGTGIWELGAVGGLNAQFDADNDLDSIGWDGKFGADVGWRPTASWTLRVRLMHDSSHTGDEYMERNDRVAGRYTRHEVAAGAAWLPGERWLTYVEGGVGRRPHSDAPQRSARVQAGFEYRVGGRRRPGWYAAADLASAQERGWRLDTAVQAGWAVPAAGRTWRCGVQWHHGRSPIGDFYRTTEQVLSAGLWIDL
jgi:hypothetical protein